MSWRDIFPMLVLDDDDSSMRIMRKWERKRDREREKERERQREREREREREMKSRIKSNHWQYDT